MRRHAGGLKPPTPFFARPGNRGTYPGQATGAQQGLPSCPPSQRGAQGEGGEKRRGEGRGGQSRGGRRKPVRAVPTAPGEPAKIARGAPRGAEGRVPEEGRPKPQSGSANSSRRQGPSLEGNGSPFVSLPRPPTARRNHESRNPKCFHAKASKRQGTRRGPAVSRPSRAAEPLKVFGPPPPAARPASCSVKPLLLPPPPFSNLPLQPSICAELARPRLRRGPATPLG